MGKQSGRKRKADAIDAGSDTGKDSDVTNGMSNNQNMMTRI